MIHQSSDSYLDTKESNLSDSSDQDSYTNDTRSINTSNASDTRELNRSNTSNTSRAELDQSADTIINIRYNNQYTHHDYETREQRDARQVSFQQRETTFTPRTVKQPLHIIR
jgi:hypothetical protein